MGYLAHHCKPFGPCATAVRTHFPLRAINHAHSQWVLDFAGAALCHWFCIEFLQIEVLGIAKGQKASTLVASGPQLCFLQMTWFCWFHWVLASGSHWSNLQPSVKGPERQLAPPRPRPWFWPEKGGVLILGQEEVLSQVKEFRYLRVLFVRAPVVTRSE